MGTIRRKFAFHESLDNRFLHFLESSKNKQFTTLSQQDLMVKSLPPSLKNELVDVYYKSIKERIDFFKDK